MTTGEYIRTLRQKEMITQTQLARLLTVTTATIRSWERDEESCPPSQLDRIRRMLHGTEIPEELEGVLIDDSLCSSCYYWRRTSFSTSDSFSCHYLLDENSSRGCKAGKDCTRYRPGKRTEAELKKRRTPRYDLRS